MRVDRDNTELSEVYNAFSEFAHDARTPLMVVREFSSLIRDGFGGAVTHEQEEFLSHIDTAVDEISSLIEDCDAVVALRAEAIPFDRARCSVGSVVDRLHALLGLPVSRGASSVAGQPGLSDVFCDVEYAAKSLASVVSYLSQQLPEGVEIMLEVDDSMQEWVEFRVTSARLQDAPEGQEEGRSCWRLRDVAASRSSGLALRAARMLVEYNLGYLEVRQDEDDPGCWKATVMFPKLEPRSVCRRYLSVLQSKRPGTRVGAVRVSMVPRRGTGSELRQMLVSKCSSHDLIIPTGEQGDFMILGEETAAVGLAHRLKTSGTFEMEAADQTGLVVETLGGWGLPEEQHEAVDVVAALVCRGD